LPNTPSTVHRHDNETYKREEGMKANTEKQLLRLYAANKIRIQVVVHLGLGLGACRCGLPYVTFLIPALYAKTKYTPKPKSLFVLPAFFFNIF